MTKRPQRESTGCNFITTHVILCSLALISGIFLNVFVTGTRVYDDPTKYLSQHSSLDGCDSSDDSSGNKLPILLIRSVILYIYTIGFIKIILHNPLLYIDEGLSPNGSTDAGTSQSNSSALEPSSEIGQPRTSAGIIHQILAMRKTVLFVY